MVKKKEGKEVKKIKVKLIKSFYGCKKDQIGTIRALGLKKIGQVKEFEDSPVIRGMVFKVKHLVEVS